MKLQFDANQEFQKKAVKSGVDLFVGQANDQLKATPPCKWRRKI